MALLYEELVAQGSPEKRESALKAMQLAIQRDGKSLMTLLAVARWALAACQLDMAEEQAQAALQLDGQSIDALLLVGLVARHREDLATAQEVFELAHLRSPANFDVLVQLALVLIEQTDAEKQQLALDYAELNFRSNTDQSLLAGREAAVTLAWVLHRLGRKSDAVATVQAALNAGAVQEEIAYIAARVLSENGLVDQSLTVLSPAMATGSCFPNHQRAQQLLKELQSR